MTMDSGDGTVSHIGADDADLQPGEKVGEYVVEKKIGEGGFGTVFCAEHPVIGKVVAIKVLNRQYSAQPEMVSRFVAEARAVNQIRHRHIIDIFAFGQLEDGRHYYVMEFLDGLPLDEFLDQRGPMPLAEAIPILRMVARALDAAHAKGIAHRDLKPENVFLVEETDGTVYPKLLDFGIAKLLNADTERSHKTRTGAPIGTPFYMSPEQCRGRDVDHRTDIYAFGIMAYKMLTGDVPFDGEDYMDILLKQMQEEPAPPSSRVPGLTESVDAGVAWMLKKDPAERPPNLVTSVRSLEDAAASAGIEVPAGPAPTGVYAARTSPQSAQRTPSAVTPMPRSGTGPADFGSAPTMAASVSEELAAAAARPKSKLPLVLGALAGAAVVAAAVFFLVRGMAGGGDEAGDAEGGEAAAVTDTDMQPEPEAETATAPEPEVEPEPEPEPALPRYVTITIEGAPEGAEVHGPGGKLLGLAPTIQLPRGEDQVTLVLEADGYKPGTATVSPGADATVEVAMKKIRRGHVRRPPRGDRGGKGGRGGKAGGGDEGGDDRDTLEDPFKK